MTPRPEFPATGFMRRALRLARKGAGRTSPNPAVGAVVVRGGRIVGEGYHHAAGLPHAEIEALRRAGGAAGGADLYVTLEPCDHLAARDRAPRRSSRRGSRGWRTR